jgi:hypothetical protein
LFQSRNFLITVAFEQVNIHYCLAKGSADDIIWPCIEKKINVIGNTLDGEVSQAQLRPTSGACCLHATARVKDDILKMTVVGRGRTG